MVHDVLKGISSALFREFGYENYIEEIQQDLKEPCFFISCIQPQIRRYLGRRYILQNQFLIQYFPKIGNHANAECYDTAEKMFGCLEVIQAGSGLLRGTGMKYEVVDGILHFFVNYDFFMQEVGQEETMGKMESYIN